MLVVLSPPLWVSWVLGVGFAIDPLATVLVAGAFLAVFARRDFLCLADKLLDFSFGAAMESLDFRIRQDPPHLIKNGRRND
jgi:hypothetical protein